MHAVLIGGTGTISTSVTHELLQQGWQVTLINRGTDTPELRELVELGARSLVCDVNDEPEMRELLASHRDLQHVDCVAEFVAFTHEQVERDIRLFLGKTSQYIFVSSASAYAKPARSYIISEGTTLANPYWQYSQQKIECERVLMEAYRKLSFPVTIVRPSHTYDRRSLPLGVHGAQGSWQVAQRMLDGKPVIVHGDGSSLWTLTHARDFAVGFVGLMANMHAIGEAVQIMGNETLTWDQIYSCIGAALGVTPQLVHVSSQTLAAAGPQYDFTGSLTGDKAVSVVFDTTKLQRLVPQFATRTSFDQGARECVDYILNHPEYQQADPEFDRWSDELIAQLDVFVDHMSAFNAQHHN